MTKGTNKISTPLATQLHKLVYNLSQHNNRYQVWTFQYQTHNLNTKHRGQEYKHKTQLSNKDTLILSTTQNKIHITKKYTIKISWVTNRFKEKIPIYISIFHSAYPSSSTQDTQAYRNHRYWQQAQWNMTNTKTQTQYSNRQTNSVYHI